MCHPIAPTLEVPENVAFDQISIQGNEIALPTYLARPRDDKYPKGGHAVIVVISDFYGASPYYQNMACHLAQAGFVAAVPDLFVRQGPVTLGDAAAATARVQQLDPQTVMEDLQATLSWLEGQPYSNGRAGCIGFCMGGTYCMLWPTYDSRINATAVYYGFPHGETRLAGGTVTALQRLDHLQAPLVGFWGTNDGGVPIERVEELRAGLAARGKQFEITTYPGLPHGFMRIGATQGQYASESQDAWSRTLAFFHHHLDDLS
ncbi:MAG: dienelactone hydrolase family protein [Chloroflexi bacterium]|nr:dienelactone hydrolase family protein [Chloroflexota bacterium]